MLIRWIIVLFGVSLGSTSTKAGVITATSKNDTADQTSLNFKSRSFKPKRQLDDFDFDVSTFDTSASVFPAKSENENGLPSFDNEDTDLSALIPTSFKVTRSNSENLGTHGQNFEPSSFPASNFGPNSAQQSSEVQASAYSNEDQDALGQARQSNTAYNNQATTPYYEGYVNQPKYALAKPSAFSSENDYKTPQKLSYNGYTPLSDISSNVPIYGPLTQLQPLASGHQQIQQPIPQNNLYKAPFAQGIKNFQPAKVYAPTHRHGQQQQPFDSPFQNFGQSPYDYSQYTTNPTVEINGKKLALPVLQLQTAPNFPGYIQALDSTPVIFSAESGIQYKTEPNFGITLNYAEPKKYNPNQRSGTNAPFLNSPNPGPIQVLPVQTASSTAQFPKYKGASVAQFPAKGFSKIPNDYQEFKSQPQLHFDGNGNRKPKSYHKPAFYTIPLQEIKKDVEVINKKKPIPPLPKHDEDDDDDENERAENESGEEYKGDDTYFRKNDHGVEPLPRKYFKESELEGDFKPSKSYPFKEYDDKFVKQKKAPAKDNYEDDEDEDTNVDLAAKYRYLSKSDKEEDDDDDENESAEEKPQSKYKAHAGREEFRNNSEEDDGDEEETQKQEKKEKSVDYDRGSQHSSKKPRILRREHRKNYEDEFDESFKKKSSKPKSSHHRSKGFSASEDRPHSYSNFHKDESPSKSSKKGRHRTYRDETGEPSHRPFASSGSPKYSSKFFPKSDESNTRRSYLNSKESSTKTPQVIWEESYGLRLNSPEDESRPSSYSREEASASSRKPLPAPVHEFTSTKPSSGHKASSAINAKEVIGSYDNGSSTYSPRSSWKTPSIKKKPTHGDSYSRPSTASGLRSLAHTKQGFFSPSLGRGELFHSLKGI